MWRWRVEQENAGHARSACRQRQPAHGDDCIPRCGCCAWCCSACQCGSYGLTLWIPQIVKGISGAERSDGGLHLGDSLHRRRRSPCSGSAPVPIAAASGSCMWRCPSFIGAAGFAASAYLLSPVPGMIALTIAAMGDLCTRGPFWALPPRFLCRQRAGGRHRADQHDGIAGRLRGADDGGLCARCHGRLHGRIAVPGRAAGAGGNRNVDAATGGAAARGLKGRGPATCRRRPCGA